MIVRLTALVNQKCLSTHADPEFYLYDPPLAEREEGSVDLIKRQPTAKREGNIQINDFTVRNKTNISGKVDCMPLALSTNSI